MHQSGESIRLCRGFCGKARSAHAHAPARVLPELFVRVELAQRARDGWELVLPEMLGNFLVILRFRFDELDDPVGETRDQRVVMPGRLRLGIGLALDVVADLRAVRVGVGNTLEALARYAFAYRGIYSHFGPCGHHAGRSDGETRVERLGARTGYDDDVPVALH